MVLDVNVVFVDDEGSLEGEDKPVMSFANI